MKVKPTLKRGHVVVELDRKDEALLVESAAPVSSPFQIKKILVPVDFSECSKKALQYALPFAKQFDATLTLLHVVQVNYYVGDFGTIDTALLETEMRKNGENQLADLRAKEVGKDLRCETVLRSGRVVSEIVDVAKQTETDLIILSTHGHTGLKHVLLGSVAENVVRHAPCPVLIVRQQEHDFIAH
ncbi:MAG: universal stress protein [Verrucomicrobiales bacterium]|nr:universal stress protein [Verrucomicrobiales bacterium]